MKNLLTTFIDLIKLTKERLSLSKNLYKRYVESPDVILNKNKETKLVSVKYKHLGVDWTNPDTLIARGLVITKRGKIVARPYDKFFNYHQFGQSNLLPAEVQYLTEWHSDLDYIMDKADGSLVIAYTYKGKQFMSSSGSVHSEHSDLFLKLLSTYPKATQKKIFELGKTHTLLFEYVGPNNQIVINYLSEEFILHGVRNTTTGEYFSLQELQALSKELGIKLIDIYGGISSLDDVLNNLKTLIKKEGFVAVFKDGYRLKFKTDEYLELHVLSTGVRTRKNARQLTKYFIDDVLDDVMAKVLEDKTSSMYEQQSEIFALLVNQIKEYQVLIDSIQNEVDKMLTEIKDRKEIALLINADETKDKTIYFFFLAYLTKTRDRLSLAETLTKSNKVRDIFETELLAKLKEN